MPWSTGLESQRGNITSLLGTLAQMKEGKKNRRSALLRDILGIGAQFGGAALQNQWAKKATAQEQQFKSLQDTIAAGRAKTAGEEDYARKLSLGELDFQRQKELQEMADTAALARTRASGRGEDGVPGAPSFTGGDYVGAKWQFYLESPAGQRRGLVDRTGNLLLDKITPDVIDEFIAQSYPDAKITAQKQGINLDPVFWKQAVMSFLGSQGIEAPPPPPPGGDKAAKKAERDAARAAEMQKREVLLSQVQEKLKEVAQSGRGATQPALAINSGVLNLYTQNSMSLTRILEQLDQALNTHQQPAANPVQQQMQGILKAGVPGLPKQAPAIGTPTPAIDLSKIRW